MKVFISRVSTEEQSELRQIQNVEHFDKVVIDRCDGDIPLWERPQASNLRKLVDNGTIKHIEFHQVDRMGRNLKNILEEYEELTKLGVRVVCREPYFQNFTESGEEDLFSKLLLSILGSVGQYEKSLTKKRQLQGIELTKKLFPHKYSGRKQNTKEDKFKFLSKPKNQKAIEYLNKGMKGVEVSKLVGISLNTITKIKKNLAVEI
ncbi:recombinase family protein [Flavobacteriaceae bacterium]|nr:recombinase family protein [Flavobacteriaceae bacterium]